jgi:hypothetical protein
MVQGWYQGGINLFDWTDPDHPIEIAYHDRGPIDPNQMQMAGSWSVYWYNGLIVNSEIARGLDIFELVPSAYISQNEIDAAKSVRLDYLNAQGQPQYIWPPSFALARAYVDQLERSGGLRATGISSTRTALNSAENASGNERREILTRLAEDVQGRVGNSSRQAKVRMLVGAIRDLAAAS